MHRWPMGLVAPSDNVLSETIPTMMDAKKYVNDSTGILLAATLKKLVRPTCRRLQSREQYQFARTLEQCSVG